jgi:hypothetical protein
MFVDGGAGLGGAARSGEVAQLASGCGSHTATFNVQGEFMGSDIDWRATGLSASWSGPACPTPEYAYVARGNGLDAAAVCVPTDQGHEVRCCSGTPIYAGAGENPNQSYQQRNGCEVYAESYVVNGMGLEILGQWGEDTTSCLHYQTYSAGYDACAADGARLCTVAEVEADCTAGTGCAHNEDYIWTSDACTESDLPDYFPVDSVTTSVTVVGTTSSGDDVVQISVNLQEPADNVYSMFGNEDSPMVFPAAGQDTTLGADIGGVSAASLMIAPTLAFDDSWLTVGITDGAAEALGFAPADLFDGWNSGAELIDSNGGVFWMVPADGPSGSVVVAQLASECGSNTATFNLQGQSTETGDDSDGDWRAYGITVA